MHRVLPIHSKCEPTILIEVTRHNLMNICATNASVLFGSCLNACVLFGSCLNACVLFDSCLNACVLFGSCLNACVMFGSCLNACYIVCVGCWYRIHRVTSLSRSLKLVLFRNLLNMAKLSN